MVEFFADDLNKILNERLIPQDFDGTEELKKWYRPRSIIKNKVGKIILDASEFGDEALINFLKTGEVKK